MLKNMLIAAGATAVLALGLGQASANVVAGTVYFVTDPQAANATPAQIAALPASDLGATFDAPSTPLSFASGGLYTLGEFLASGGAFNISLFNGHALSNSVGDTLFDFQGSVSVTTGDTFVAGHDDGLTLTIGGLTVISEPGPTSFTTTTRTYTGPSGTFPFDLVYGECCGAPAVLDVTLPLVTPGIPEPATLVLLGVGLMGVGALRRRR